MISQQQNQPPVPVNNGTNVANSGLPSCIQPLPMHVVQSANDLAYYQTIIQNRLIAPDMVTYAAKQQLDFSLEVAKENLATSKKIELEGFKTEEARKRKEQQADVASRRAMQATEILISTDGIVTVTRELFDGKASKQKKIRVSDGKIYFCKNKEEEILYVSFQQATGRMSEMHLLLSALDQKTINRKFNIAGVNFGYGREKETQLRIQFVTVLTCVAQRVELPLRHGWVRMDGKLDIVLPDQLVWEEVRTRV